MNGIYSYDLGPRVLNGIDISIQQPNYFVKYGPDALESQQKFLQRLGIGHLFERRIMIASHFDSRVISVNDLSFSGYETDSRSRCNGFDGVIVTEPEIPLLSGWGDCPWLLVASDSMIGTVHAARKTLDNHVLYSFFEAASKKTDLASFKIGLSPFIPTPLFGHQQISLERRRDWEDSGAIHGDNGEVFIDLYAMIIADLMKIGISREQVVNARLSSYAISQRSHELGGYAVSHRHALQTEKAQEGRGAFCLMLQK